MKETGTVMREVNQDNVTIITSKFEIGHAPPAIALFGKGHVYLFSSVKVEGSDILVTYAKVNPKAVKAKLTEEQVEALRNSAFYLYDSRIVSLYEVEIADLTAEATIGKYVFHKASNRTPNGIQYVLTRS